MIRGRKDTDRCNSKKENRARNISSLTWRGGTCGSTPERVQRSRESDFSEKGTDDEATPFPKTRCAKVSAMKRGGVKGCSSFSSLSGTIRKKGGKGKIPTTFFRKRLCQIFPTKEKGKKEKTKKALAGTGRDWKERPFSCLADRGKKGKGVGGLILREADMQKKERAWIGYEKENPFDDQEL